MKKSKIIFFSIIFIILTLFVNESVYAIGKALDGFDDYYKDNIIIEDGVTRINDYEYADKENIKSVTIPESVKEIGEGAFKNCINLRRVDFASEDIVCNATAFDNTEWAKMQDDFIIIGNVLVRYVGEKKYVRIPDGITKVGDNAFLNHVRIEDIILPEGLEEIGNNAFSSCQEVESVKIPKSIKKIGENAFNENTKVISYKKQVINNFTIEAVRFILGAFIIFLIVITVIAIVISKKQGTNGYLSKEYMSKFVLNRYLYYFSIIFSIFLFYMIFLSNYYSNAMSYDLQEKLIEIAIVGYIGFGLAYILTEVIRKDFPFGFARLVIRTLKTMLIDSIALIPLIIILGITYNPSYFFAIMFFPVIYLLIRFVTSGNSGESPIESYENKLDMQERIINNGFNAEENFNFGLKNKDSIRMEVGKMQIDRHKKKMDKFKEDLENKNQQ